MIHLSIHFIACRIGHKPVFLKNSLCLVLNITVINMKISYYAVFDYENDGINISFPDIPEAFTCAFSTEEAVLMAQEVLELTLHKRNANELPPTTDKEKNQAVKLISVNMKNRKGILYGKNIIEYESDNTNR